MHANIPRGLLIGLMVCSVMRLDAQRIKDIGTLPLRAMSPRAPFVADSSGILPAFARTDSLGIRRSYWLPGLVIGGVVGLVGGLQLQHELCRDSDSGRCPSGADHVFFLVPTVVFALLGGLIGSAIHRQ